MIFDKLLCPYCHYENLEVRQYFLPLPYNVNNDDDSYFCGYECPECGLCGYGEDANEAYKDMCKNVNLHRITAALSAICRTLKERNYQEVRA